jgi:hypothetical protein
MQIIWQSDNKQLALITYQTRPVKSYLVSLSCGYVTEELALVWGSRARQRLLAILVASEKYDKLHKLEARLPYAIRYLEQRKPSLKQLVVKLEE